MLRTWLGVLSAYMKNLVAKGRAIQDDRLDSFIHNYQGKSKQLTTWSMIHVRTSSAASLTLMEAGFSCFSPLYFGTSVARCCKRWAGLLWLYRGEEKSTTLHQSIRINTWKCIQIYIVFNSDCVVHEKIWKSIQRKILKCFKEI